MMDADRTPVIAAIGEFTQHPGAFDAMLEPVDLMAEAVRRADADAGARLLSMADSLDVVNLISWPYVDPATSLAARLRIRPSRLAYGVVGGETPLRLIQEAASRIAAGVSQVAIVTGGEAHHTAAAASRAGVILDWTPKPVVAAPSVRSQDLAAPLAKALGAHIPVTVYPLYETATAHAWGQTPAEAAVESGAVGAAMSHVAAGNPHAWIRRSHAPVEIVTPSAGNRVVAAPYTKLMVANINVNQAAAVIVTSLAKARAAGLDDGRLVFLHDAFAAEEPTDYLARNGYAGCTARDAVLDRLAAAVPDHSGPLELYSCFPIVPKAARRRLGLATDAELSVAGGLTFFGAPLNNYMTHAVCAMARRLRERPDVGLLYGQGGFMTKHFGLVVGSSPASGASPAGLTSVQAEADHAYGEVPGFDSAPSGVGRVEAHTVIHDRDGGRRGVVVIRTLDGRRSLAEIPQTDQPGLALLEASDAFAVGRPGDVRVEGEGRPIWRAA